MRFYLSRVLQSMRPRSETRQQRRRKLMRIYSTNVTNIDL